MFRSKMAVRGALAGLGYRLQLLAPEERHYFQGYNPAVPLPPEAAAELRPDHPRLLDLSRRYAALDSPLGAHTQWRTALRTTLTDLQYFRGESAYLWQYMKLFNRIKPHPQVRLEYYIYTRYIADRDPRRLLGGSLVEDGQFGCFTFRFRGLPTVSRDLLDSVNELYFLDRHFDLFGRTGVRVLDIGAGYGRLAHRMLTAVAGVARYACIDAVPRSTFLSEFYLRHRGLLGADAGQAHVIPLDQAAALTRETFDLAVNIHSFSEMSYGSVQAWLGLLAEMKVPWLLIVPNEPELHSHEADGTRRPCADLVEAAGYRLAAREPTVQDDAVRELFGAHDCFQLYRRA